MRTFLCLALILVTFAARAQEIDILDRALDDYNGGRNARAAVGFFEVEEKGTSRDNRIKAEYYLAQSLSRLGQGFGAFFYYQQIIAQGSQHPYYYKAIEGAVAVIEQSGDEVLGPNVLAKAYAPEFSRLPPEVLAKVNYYLALLDYRKGAYDDAAQLLRASSASNADRAQSLYLQGLLQQRKDPREALQTFREILALQGDGYRDLAGVKELTHLALGRSLYALQRFAEASAEYAQLPRFSRHWDEALFEGAYADLMNDDPGAALGKLHSLHSPHLSDEFAPESLNLTAVIYHQRCLYPQVREVIAQFDSEYVPMKDQLKTLLKASAGTDAYWQMLQPGSTALPSAVRHHLEKNERVSAMVGYIGRLDGEAAKVKSDEVLAKSPLGPDLLDLIAKQKALMSQVAGKFIEGRLTDTEHLIEVLDGEKEIVGFETTKGEKETLESNQDVKARLASQHLGRPPMPASGHEYWPFDGEYWPDEIGYYKLTVKDACAPSAKKEP
jgi:tetratricopeptide (TPR) repeat protein